MKAKDMMVVGSRVIDASRVTRPCPHLNCRGKVRIVSDENGRREWGDCTSGEVHRVVERSEVKK